MARNKFDPNLRSLILRDGEPCSHRGCLSHVSHPCEGCGRTAGRYVQPPDPSTPTDSDRLVEIEARYHLRRHDTEWDDVAWLISALHDAQTDTKRLDKLASWTKGDQGICPPGNHGGEAANWLVFREDDSKGDSFARWAEEHEAPTLREALDLAASHPTPPQEPV